MKILVIGGGGREHTLIWKINQSPELEKVYCVPGNPGIAEIAECHKIEFEKDFGELITFVKNEKIDLTVVGPEAPLVAGIVDAFEAEGLFAFGPSKMAAEIEGSKVFAKESMRSWHIPTAPFVVFDSAPAAEHYLAECQLPIVIKADGLAAGKGAFVCRDLEETNVALKRIMINKEWGAAGDKVVIEKFLEGEEVSFIVLTDGDYILPLASSQDHKALYDSDQGPNTGGMGAYSPAPIVTPMMQERIMKEIIRPMIQGMALNGTPYQGALYAGLMITKEGPMVLEFNCRLGDPETQPMLMRLKSDLVPALKACLNGTLHQVKLEWEERPAVCVVMASGGYPGSYEKGKVISGLDAVQKMKDVMVFHAGTALNNGQLTTNGGRVLGVTALGNNIYSAINHAYEAVGKIHFDQAHFRRDIGYRALDRH